jgi:hypothetical protein
MLCAAAWPYAGLPATVRLRRWRSAWHKNLLKQGFHLPQCEKHFHDHDETWLILKGWWWDFGWLMPRTDGVVARLLCDPYTLVFQRGEGRYAIRWFVR